VWPWVGDITRHAEWSPRPYRVEHVSGEPNQPGARYRSVGWVPPNDGEHVNDVEITAVVPERTYALVGIDSNGRFPSRYELRPVDGGTEVTWHLEFPQMKGINAVIVPILFPFVAKPDARKRIALLKQRVEAAGSTGP
jgi:hypothetical protein